MWKLWGMNGCLRRRSPFSKRPRLDREEIDAFDLPREAAERGTLYEHCTRAIERTLSYGVHGLPLIGSGDWNDGMNRVGIGGRGESTWLGWFLHTVLVRFAGLAERHQDGDRALRYRKEARRLAEMLELAWDGEWYRRGYFDDGTPIGSHHSEECKIDAIAQSWAVLSGAAPQRRAERAMDSVRTQLIRRGSGIVLLLTPPWDRSSQDPGYIKGYVPGIRENGGQYTQAALWTAMAIARLGSGDEAMELFHMLNPINRTRTDVDVETYKAEPYVIAADVYAHPSHLGQGRVDVVHRLGRMGVPHGAGVSPGLRSSGSRLFPGSLHSVHVEGVLADVAARGHSIRDQRGESRGCCRGVVEAWLDDRPVDPAAIPVVQDGRIHLVRAILGKKAPELQASLR